MNFLKFNLANIISIICGLIFLIIAFYFPKIKQNTVVGIKTKWTLKNEEVWNQTHRLGKITWIIGGVLFIGNIFFNSELMYVLNIIIGLCFIIIVPYVYSYIIWNKKQKMNR
ncbi:SdpI family protein [Defluviitalea phaphyphila]|uniref:SdpI family protein n=1 Tax=Defluviitalea phaphyphila TaxID=1473580 RepID=UPI0007308E56|nr:SdpI family protein [Defluviitalea phaphyphila]